MICKNLKLSQDFNGIVSLTLEVTNKNDIKSLENLSDELLDVTIKKHRKKRTLTQNSYLWILCDKLAAKLSTEKEQVYRLAIKHVGVFELLPIKNESVERWITTWESKGEGFICEEFRESKLEGYKTLQCYYGSSVYNTKEQARLIDYIVEECKEQGIETMTREDIERLK